METTFNYQDFSVFYYFHPVTTLELLFLKKNYMMEHFLPELLVIFSSLVRDEKSHT
jgi:hypothetical protein